MLASPSGHVLAVPFFRSFFLSFFLFLVFPFVFVSLRPLFWENVSPPRLLITRRRFVLLSPTGCSKEKPEKKQTESEKKNVIDLKKEKKNQFD